MQWSDEGVVLSARRHGESALIVQLLTREHGRHAGLARGQGPKTRAVYQIGNQLAATWRARLAEHLGSLTGELVRSHAGALLDDPLRLACLVAAAAVAEVALPERQPHSRVYDGLLAVIDALERDSGWAVATVEWEDELLAELGFGLDLSSCAATGGTEDLVYVSPRSGQAVSAAAGEAYRERLLRLPRFLLPGAPPQQAGADEVLDGLELTGFFLERRVFAPHGRKMPAARSRFVDALRQAVSMSGG